MNGGIFVPSEHETRTSSTTQWQWLHQIPLRKKTKIRLRKLPVICIPLFLLFMQAIIKLSSWMLENITIEVTFKITKTDNYVIKARIRALNLRSIYTNKK